MARVMMCECGHKLTKEDIDGGRCTSCLSMIVSMKGLKLHQVQGRVVYFTVQDKIDRIIEMFVEAGSMNRHSSEEVDCTVFKRDLKRLCALYVQDRLSHPHPGSPVLQSCDSGEDYKKFRVCSTRLPYRLAAKYAVWGTYGRDGKESLKMVKLIDCDIDHLCAIDATQRLDRDFRYLVRGVAGIKAAKLTVEEALTSRWEWLREIGLVLKANPQ